MIRQGGYWLLEDVVTAPYPALLINEGVLLHPAVTKQQRASGSCASLFETDYVDSLSRWDTLFVDRRQRWAQNG